MPALPRTFDYVPQHLWERGVIPGIHVHDCGLHLFSLEELTRLNEGIDSSRSHLSMDSAASRPSRIAHTMREAPRRASPAAKIPGTLVRCAVSVATFPRASSPTARSVSNRSFTGPVNPIAR